MPITSAAPKRCPTDVLDLVDEEVRDSRLRPQRGSALDRVEESAAIIAGLTDTLTTSALGDGPNGMVPARSVYALAQVMGEHSQVVANYLEALLRAAEERPRQPTRAAKPAVGAARPSVPA